MSEGVTPIEPCDMPMEPTETASGLLAQLPSPNSSHKNETPTVSIWDGEDDFPVEARIGTVSVPANAMQGLELLQSEADAILIICGITAGGPWSQWNTSHPNHQCEAGDRILMVNGKSEHAEAWSVMTHRSAKSRNMNLVIRKPLVNRVRVVKHEAESMGLVLIPIKNGLLFVDTIRDSGPIHQWNQEHPDNKVRTLDMLTEVNGKTSGIVEELSETGMLELVFKTHLR